MTTDATSDACFQFERVTFDDVPMLTDWLSRPHVARWFGEPPSREALRQELEEEQEADAVWRYVARLGGRPVAYIQAYDVMRADPAWWREERDPGARGIDQYLAHPEDLGRGLGTQLVAQFVAKLFLDPAVTKVQTDPSPDNARAIRAYEKAGFQPVRTLDTPDGPALLMVVRRGA
ncbi:GNAT family N-acetyltransferase [Corallococcus sp. M7]